ncbi:DUF6232 family protein [Chloroflexota bacterium]
MYTDCPACRASNPPGSDFCGECGAPLAPVEPSAELRQPEEPALESPDVSEEAQSATEQEASEPERLEPAAEALPSSPPEEPLPSEDKQPQLLTPSSLENRVYYEGEGVRITRTVAVLGDDTYNMADVTSVWMEPGPARRIPGIVTAVIGLLIMSCFMFAGENLVIKLVLLFGGLVAAVLGVFLAVLGKSEYTIRIERDSGEVGEYVSQSHNHVERIVRALDRAIAARG